MKLMKEQVRNQIHDQVYIKNQENLWNLVYTQLIYSGQIYK